MDRNAADSAPPTQIVARLPTVDEHRSLAEAVGWAHAFHWPALPASLAGSLFGVVAIEHDRVVGMGRVVGDGAMYFYLQDIAVLPDRQGQGIGQAMVTALLDRIAEQAPAFVGLFATAEAEPLYLRNGFGVGDMQGMVRLVS